jgi:hypothetical protein
MLVPAEAHMAKRGTNGAELQGFGVEVVPDPVNVG